MFSLFSGKAMNKNHADQIKLDFPAKKLMLENSILWICTDFNYYTAGHIWSIYRIFTVSYAMIMNRYH